MESTRRKCEVIERLAAAADVATPARSQRAEDWARGPGTEAYDVVTARALAPLAVLAEYAAPLLGGRCARRLEGRAGRGEEAGAIAAQQLGLEPDPCFASTPIRARGTTTSTSCGRSAPRPTDSRAEPGRARKRPLG